MKGILNCKKLEQPVRSLGTFFMSLDSNCVYREKKQVMDAVGSEV